MSDLEKSPTTLIYEELVAIRRNVENLTSYLMYLGQYMTPQTPWPNKVLTEFITFKDHDGDGHVFGRDIYIRDLESYPQIMHNIRYYILYELPDDPEKHPIAISAAVYYHTLDDWADKQQVKHIFKLTDQEIALAKPE